MQEEEFDRLFGSTPFRSDETARVERALLLGNVLWRNLERQLRAPHPEIPSGLDLLTLRQLQRSTYMIVAALKYRPPALTHPLLNFSRGHFHRRSPLHPLGSAL
jgi:hypothetical protein